MNFKNMKISKKLLIGFGAVVVLTIVLSAISIFSSIRLDRTYTELVEFYDERLIVLNEIETMFMDTRRAVSQTGVFAGLGLEDRIKEQADIAAARVASINEGLDRFNKAVEDDKNYTAQDKASRKEISDSVRTALTEWYNDLAQPLIQANLTGDRQEALNIFSENTSLVSSIVDNLEYMKTRTVNVANEKNSSTTSIANFMMIILVVIAAVIIVVSIILGILITKSTVSALRSSINSMNKITDHIKEAARMLSEGSQNIAEGAGEQASSIEETSASINEETSMITQNAENTRIAAQIASDTINMANKGMLEMQNMTQAMGEIKDSSDKVGKIVKTIDDIAFQTNLLAINATVEAARASGDAGRSFGVVAEEVRNLAQKSAESASNTTSIIEKNISLTNSGQGISSGVSMSLEEITEKAGHLNKLITEINAASEEQAQGIKQINIAVSQIEKVTQQTAAAAEETAASSQNLQNEAYNLAKVVEDMMKLI